MNSLPPRFSHGYFQLRNRFGMLVETHSWKDYLTRVRITRNAIDAVLAPVAREQLAATPDLATEFRGRIAADPKCAQSAAARLEFFARRHPSWYERDNPYPVARTAVPPS